MSTSCDLECAGAHNRTCGELRHLFDCSEQLETLRETLDAYEVGAWAALDALAAAAGSSAEAVQAALLASVPALIAIPWKPHTSQAHTHALLSDIARAMGASPNKL